MTTEKCLRVGYGRTNIMPDEPMPLDSYGNAEKRIHESCANEIWYSALAFTDEDDKTLLIMSYDITQCSRLLFDKIKQYAMDKYGIDEAYIHLSGTHTHSSVAVWLEWDSVKRYREKVIARAKEAIDMAMEDRKKAELWYANTKTEKMNFVRHYWRQDGTTCGDNHGPWSTAPVVTHVKDPDETMRVLKITRVDETGNPVKDLVLVNWQAHNHLTGGSKKYVLAADFSGAFRECLEKEHDCLFTFFQGCAGDLNEVDNRLPDNTRTRDLYEYGQILADYVNDVYDKMTPLKSGKVKSLRRPFAAPLNHSMDHLYEAAKKIRDDWRASGFNNKEAVAAGEPYGIHSPYMATAICRHYEMGESFEMNIQAYSIGDMGWTSVPVEMFDTTGVNIRKASPFEFTFTQGYTDESFGYLPTRDAYEYGCYEADTTNFAPGAAELVEEKLINMLHELKEA